MGFPLSRSTFGTDAEEIRKTLEKTIDKPEGFKKELGKRIKEMRPLAEKIQAMVMTPGWKEIIQPFLENQANAARVFNIVKSEKSEKLQQMELAKAEAFFNLQALIKNFLSILKVPMEDVEEKVEEEIEEEVIDRERK